MSNILDCFDRGAAGYNEELTEEHYPGAFCFKPMKVGTFPNTRGITLEDIATDKSYFSTEKTDGFWYALEKIDNDTYYLFSRNTSRATGLPSEKAGHVVHLQEPLEGLANGTILIGEIWTGNPLDNSSNVTSVMGALEAKALARQKKNGLMHYWVHDMIAYDGEDLTGLPTYDRYLKLQEVFEELDLGEDYPFLKVAPEYEGDNALDFFEEVLDHNGEGIVMKRKKDKYGFGKRPAYSSVKLKQADGADVVIMGFGDPTRLYTGSEQSEYLESSYLDTDGTWVPFEKLLRGQDSSSEIDTGAYQIKTEQITKPYFYDWKTAIVIGLYNENGDLKRIGTVSSGLNDQMRQEFAENPEEYIGRVIECSAMSLDKKEQTLRHPVFEQFRDDKNAEDCTFKETF